MVPALTARRCTRPDSHHITSSRSMFFHQSPGLWVAQWFVQRSVRLHTGNKSLRCSEKTWGCTDAVPRLTEPPTSTLLPRHSEEHAKRCTSPWCHEVDHWWAELFLGVSRSLLVPRPLGRSRAARSSRRTHDTARPPYVLPRIELWRSRVRLSTISSFF